MLRFHKNNVSDSNRKSCENQVLRYYDGFLNRVTVVEKNQGSWTVII